MNTELEKNLQEFVLENGLNKLLKRMLTVVDEYKVKKLLQPVICNAQITDMNKVISVIKQKWSAFNIKDVKISTISQTVTFKIWTNHPVYINEKYKGFIIFDGEWSETKTDEHTAERIIEEEYAEAQSMPLNLFINNGIELEII